MIPCLKIRGSLANLEGQSFFMYNNYLSAHASILKVYENVPYRKIMVISKIGACFTICLLVINGFCYIYCFMGIMHCCVA